jgi:putative MATE family efflux protein
MSRQCEKIIVILLWASRREMLYMGEFLKKLTAPKDMTEGSITSKLIWFSVPLLMTNFVQQLYNTVDSIVAGKYIGDAALAAVGNSTPMVNIMIIMFVGISSGASIMVAQYFGARDREALNTTIGNSLTMAILFALVVMVVGISATPLFLRAVNTPDEIFNDTRAYLTIIFLGAGAQGIYNISAGILRGLGDSVTALVYLCIAATVNIFADIYFVAVLDMGVAGTAWATIMAQYISCIGCVAKLISMRDKIHLTRDRFIPKADCMKRLFQLGLPSGASQAIMAMASIVVQSLTNSFGTAVIAANVIVMRIDGYIMMPNFSFGIAMTTFTGQNIGAKKIDRIKHGYKDGLRLALIVSCTMSAILFIFGKQLAFIFTDTESTAIIVRTFLRIMAAGYIAVSVNQTLTGVLRGTGDTITPMWISMLSTIIIRVPVAYMIRNFTISEQLPLGNFRAIPCSLLFSWSIGMLITIIVFKKGKWRRNLPVANAGEV